MLRIPLASQWKPIIGSFLRYLHHTISCQRCTKRKLRSAYAVQQHSLRQ
uniref:Uncharacterized protein n=1 Tax=Moniliophthora roreri TaxID=221103 RepID=A0A0W0FVU9_MONRR